MYIISDNEATYFEGESLKTVDQRPAGAWGCWLPSNDKCTLLL